MAPRNGFPQHRASCVTSWLKEPDCLSVDLRLWLGGDGARLHDGEMHETWNTIETACSERAQTAKGNSEFVNRPKTLGNSSPNLFGIITAGVGVVPVAYAEHDDLYEYVSAHTHPPHTHPPTQTNLCHARVGTTQPCKRASRRIEGCVRIVLDRTCAAQDVPAIAKESADKQEGPKDRGCIGQSA